MIRTRLLAATLLVFFSGVAGAFVATLIPPASTAHAEELKLVPRVEGDREVVIPSFADIFDQASPSVVLIRAIKLVEVGDLAMFNAPWHRQFERQPFSDEDGESKEEDRTVEQPESGSGFFFTSDGYVLTNKHVVEGAIDVTLETSDGVMRDARIVGIDPYLDVAVLKVDGDGPFPALPLGDSSELRVGEWVLAIGTPLNFQNSVTVGVVSGKSRRLELFNESALGDDYIQTDAPINPGNSGGPLITARGEVVGINTAIIRSDRDVASMMSEQVEGLGFALPISRVTPVIDQLVETGTVRRGYLGVRVTAVTPESAEWHGLDSPGGAYVESVEDGLPAARAGLLKRDIILEVDSTRVRTSQDLVDAISSKRPGESAELVVWRDRGEVKLRVDLEERTVGLRADAGVQRGEDPSRPDEGQDDEVGLGIVVEPMPQDVIDELDDESKVGLVIERVERRSPAAEKGIRRGLVLLDIDGSRMKSVDDYRETLEAIDPGTVVRLRLFSIRTGELLDVFVRVG